MPDNELSKRVGRKSFLSSKKEQYRQYRAYIKQYNITKKSYGNNMTLPYSYKKFKEVRSEDYNEAFRLDERPSSLKTMVTEQILTSYDAARTRVANFKGNLEKVIKKYRNGEKLTLVEERMLDFGTEEVLNKRGKLTRVMKDISWKDYRNDTGVLIELNNALKMEGVDYEEDVFGSP